LVKAGEDGKEEGDLTGGVEDEEDGGGDREEADFRHSAHVLLIIQMALFLQKGVSLAPVI